jgi:predicted ATPase
MCRGWATASNGSAEQGVADLQRGIADWRATGAIGALPYFWAMLAEALGLAGHAEDGLKTLTEAQELFERANERWWEAEICRLRGALLLQCPKAKHAQAETWFRRALEVARHQQAKSLELRAATSLARLWRDQGKHAEAGDLVAPVYGWFSEGFDTRDLNEARALLSELTCVVPQPR